MATGNENSLDLDAEDRWRLARRDDLANAFGIVLSVPRHGQDPDGIWRFGLRPAHGWADERMTSQFQSEMDSIVSRAVEGLLARGAVSRTELRGFRSHAYEIGPAAQGWPMLFFEFVNNARPILEDGATLLAWGYFLKELIIKIREWGSAMEREASRFPDPNVSPYSSQNSIELQPAFTRAAIVALCYVDLTNYYSISDSVTIESFPRSNYGYMSQDHPGGGESYLLRAVDGNRCFFYHALGSGNVLEHYLLVDGSLTLLPLRNLTEGSPDFSHKVVDRSAKHVIQRRRRRFFPRFR